MTGFQRGDHVRYVDDRPNPQAIMDCRDLLQIGEIYTVCDIVASNHGTIGLVLEEAHLPPEMRGFRADRFTLMPKGGK